MRVSGSVIPEQVTVEAYGPVEGYVEVRIRENVFEVESTGEKDVKTYEYDEFTFHIPGEEGLKEKIESNLKEWLITGRNMETNENASLIQDMKSALEVMGVNLNE